MKNERTFVILKHDAIQRSLVGEIMERLERTGLKFIAMKMEVPTEEKLLAHYAKDDAWFEKKGNQSIESLKAAGKEVTKPAIEYGKDILRAVVDYLRCGPVVMIVMEGNQAVGIVKKIVGGTEPLTSDVGTIRGDLTLDSYALSDVDRRCIRNLIHCSDQVEEAQREIKVWFADEEIMKYTHINEKIHYDVNLDGIME